MAKWSTNTSAKSEVTRPMFNNSHSVRLIVNRMGQFWLKRGVVECEFLDSRVRFVYSNHVFLLLPLMGVGGFCRLCLI